MLRLSTTLERARRNPPYLAASILMEQQLCVQVALLLPEQLLKIIIAPLEGNIVHSNLQRGDIAADKQRCAVGCHSVDGEDRRMHRRCARLMYLATGSGQHASSKALYIEFKA